MLLKLIHHEQHKIGITSNIHSHINHFFIRPLQKVFSREKRRNLLATNLIFIVDRKKSVYKFDWMRNWLQIVL